MAIVTIHGSVDQIAETMALPSRDPISLTEHSWFYKEPNGIVVVAELRDKDGLYLGTTNVEVPWDQIMPEEDAALEKSLVGLIAGQPLVCGHALGEKEARNIVFIIQNAKRENIVPRSEQILPTTNES